MTPATQHKGPAAEIRVMITGGNGQLGRELTRSAPVGMTVRALSREECDITNAGVVKSAVSDFAPDMIVNAAAYTLVDRAEDEADAAFAINAHGAGNVAAAAAAGGARMIQISTDYVFDGARSTPYSVDAEPNPLNVYGASKLAGERVALSSNPRTTIVRCGWLYSGAGRNFLTTILTRLSTGEPLAVVDDQRGVPTSARELSDFLWWVATNPPGQKIMHWANAGEGSWYDFATAIAQIAHDRGLVKRIPSIERIATVDRPERAKRPAYSALDASESWTRSGMRASHWRDALASTLGEPARPIDASKATVRG